MTERYLRALGIKLCPTCVYFITDGDAIKVGLAICAEDRMAHLQIGNPRQLVLLGTLPGDRRMEYHLKQRWRDKLIRGEWFRDDGEIRRYLASGGAHRERRKAEKRDNPPASTTSGVRIRYKRTKKSKELANGERVCVNEALYR